MQGVTDTESQQKEDKNDKHIKRKTKMTSI